MVDAADAIGAGRGADAKADGRRMRAGEDEPARGKRDGDRPRTALPRYAPNAEWLTQGPPRPEIEDDEGDIGEESE